MILKLRYEQTYFQTHKLTQRQHEKIALNQTFISLNQLKSKSNCIIVQ